MVLTPSIPVSDARSTCIARPPTPLRNHDPENLAHGCPWVQEETILRDIDKCVEMAEAANVDGNLEQELGDEDRKLLHLTNRLGLPVEETAEHLEIPRPAAEERLWGLHNLLADQLMGVERS